MPSNKKNKFAFYLDFIIRKGGRQHSARYHYGSWEERERAIQKWKNDSDILNIYGKVLDMDFQIQRMEWNKEREPRFLKSEERFLTFLRLAKKGGFTPYYRRVK